MAKYERLVKLYLDCAKIAGKDIPESVLAARISALMQFPDDLAFKAFTLWMESNDSMPTLDNLRECVGLPTLADKIHASRAITEGKIDKWTAQIKGAAWSNSKKGWDAEAAEVASRAGITPSEVYFNWNVDTETSFLIRIARAAKAYIAEQECDTKQLSEHEKEQKALLEDPLMK
jgi:hypothetical protein